MQIYMRMYNVNNNDNIIVIFTTLDSYSDVKNNKTLSKKEPLFLMVDHRE